MVTVTVKPSLFLLPLSSLCVTASVIGQGRRLTSAFRTYLAVYTPFIWLTLVGLSLDWAELEVCSDTSASRASQRGVVEL